MSEIRAAGRAVVVTGGRFSFAALKSTSGWKSVALGIETDRGAECLGQARCIKDRKSLVLTGRYAKTGLTERVAFDLRSNGALIVTRTLINPSRNSVTVQDAWAGKHQDAGMPVLATASVRTARFCHVDNLRTEAFPWCRAEYPYVRTLPRAATWYGSQESQAIPAILFTNDDYSETLVEGQLRQDRTRLRWLVSGAPMQVVDQYRASWEMFAGGILVLPGESLALEPIFYQVLENVHPQHALDDYFSEVIARNDLRQEGNILHSKAFYDSWNYGIFQDISEEKLLRTGRWIRKHFPNIKHMIVDAGWMNTESITDTSCLYLPEDQRLNLGHFPHGLKVMADKIRAIGLSPAIWWTPSVCLDSKLVKDHPDWLMKDHTGAPYRIFTDGFLDYSLPEVQEFYHHCFRLIFKEWGFEAMKLDFWSQGVESCSIRFKQGTAVEWRDWLLATIRSYLPPDGFLETCVATAMGNPFLGKQAHIYRSCIDIAACSWQEHIYASCWVQPMLSIPGRQVCLQNVDGLGVNTELSDEENLHRLTYGFITMGGLEISGRLEELGPRHTEWIRRLTEHVDRGYKVQCPDDDAYTGKPFPKVLFVDYPSNSPTYRRGVRKHVALFNWTDTAQYVGVTGEQLGLKGTVTARDFWTDRKSVFTGGNILKLLPRRSAALYEISK